jgi:hypothetical protein
MASAGSPATKATASQGSIRARAMMLPAGVMTAATAWILLAGALAATAAPPIILLTRSPAGNRPGSPGPQAKT